eukprot:TRINITY_DN30707_c0_g1_i1.p1 TRINITY_DN30707_c0_g1~~TRINITY_DN30707_c0_g1_i1.p1  ORF type:complete len:609 (+),score=114.56 TRINITY_DN30707_c0_g1_i1:147-1973(+)
MTDPSSRVSRELKSDDSDQWTAVTVIVIGVGLFTLLVSFALGASFLFKLRARRREEKAGARAEIVEQSRSQEAPDLEMGSAPASPEAPDLEMGASACASPQVGTSDATEVSASLDSASESGLPEAHFNEAQTRSLRSKPWKLGCSAPSTKQGIPPQQSAALANALGRAEKDEHPEYPCVGESEDDGAHSESNDCFASMDLKGIVELGVSEQWYIFGDQVVLDPSSGSLEGAFASVLRGVLFGTHQVAVKVPKCLRNDLTGPMTLANEIRLYRRIRHPNIVLCYGVTILKLPSPLPCLVLDWVDGGNLSTFVTARRANGDFQRESKEVFADDQARHDMSNLKLLKETKLLIDVAWGMQYLHAQKPAILHMDLKPQNILIQDADGQPSAKITDFGLAMLLDQDVQKPNVGTTRYMAPEVQQKRTYHKPAEVYSYGLTVSFTISGQHPPKSKKVDGMSVLHKQMVQLLQVPHLPRMLVKICTRCLSPKPTSRPSFAELCILLGGMGAAPSCADGGSQQSRPMSGDQSQNQNSLSTSGTGGKSSTSEDSSRSFSSDLDVSGLSSLSGARIDKKAKEAQRELQEGSSHNGSDRSDKGRRRRSERKKDAMHISL